MRDEIIKKLSELEKTENITILYAAESGSRAWGFESPDSDYDVRFIYINEKNHYLRIDKTRDVIEIPIDEVLDINGWDLNKALRLLHSSNPTLFEWCNSSIVYKSTPYFEMVKENINEFFKPRACLYHYLNMAGNNYREYLRRDMVKAKKYFYVIRPILACKWILENNCPPPMLFSELCEAMLDKELKPTIEELLEIKVNMLEVGEIPRIEVLNKYIEENLVSLKEKIDSIEVKESKGYDRLNELFLQALEIE